VRHGRHSAYDGVLGGQGIIVLDTIENRYTDVIVLASDLKLIYLCIICMEMLENKYDAK